MFRLLRLLVGLLCRCFRSRKDLLLENLALRQQLAVFKRKCPRPRLRRTDRFFWVWLSRSRKDWHRVLIIVRPETVVAWHRKASPVLELDFQAEERTSRSQPRG